MSGNNQRASRKVKNQKQKNQNSLKVVYISNPMKVKTSAGRFRSLVQELTGKNSDVAQIMDNRSNDTNYASREFQEIDCTDYNNNRSDQYYQSLSSDDAAAASSSSLLEPNMAEQQLAFNDPFDQFGVLGNYEDFLL